MRAYKEPTRQDFENEADCLRICSGFKLTKEEALDRVVQGHGWVNWQHAIECKQSRNAE